MSINLLKIGSDPEFLLRDKSTGNLVSSIGLIPGTKDKPEKLSFGEHYTVQIDNVLGEISVDPAETGDELWDNITKTLDWVKLILPENVEIVHASSGVYSDEELSHPIARILGCSDTYNAWTMETNSSPSADSNIRGCGTHFHISYENPETETSIELAQVFDLFGTLQSVLRDPDKLRRDYYGKAGEMRILPYGVELRTPGGFTLSSKEEFDVMIDAIHKSIDFINSGNFIDYPDMAKIQFAINTQNKKLANQLLTKYTTKEEAIVV